MNESDRKAYVADSAGAYSARSIGKREFLRRLSVAGVGLSSFAAAMLGGNRPFPGIMPTQALANTGPSAEMSKWLRDVGSKYTGTKVRFVSEATPPTLVAKELAKDEFTANTGIDVEIEILPLEQVLHKVTTDARDRLGAHDLHYLDQSWAALFSGDTIDPREYYDRKRDLALPGFDWSDFSKPLMQGISTYQDKLIGIPFDIPIFILMYRKDLFDKHRLKVPATMGEYMNAVKALDEAERGNGIYGTTGQLKAGHYSLTCDWSAWLWANGGSVFDKNGLFSGGDQDGLGGLAYMLELAKHMPPAAKTWTLDGEAQSLAHGNAVMAISWGEFFPGFDGKDSRVVGLMEAACPPAESRLRSPDAAGFQEVPHIGHQGGSSICLSRYSRNPEAAWMGLLQGRGGSFCRPRQRRRCRAQFDLQGPAGTRRRQGRARHHAPLPGHRVDHQQRDGIQSQAARLARTLQRHHPARTWEAARRPTHHGPTVHGNHRRAGGQGN